MRENMATPGDTGTEQVQRNANRITLATFLVIIAAIAGECGLVVHIRRAYSAIPAFAVPACPEVYATPIVLLWVLLGSTATFALRRSSVTRLAAQVAVSSVLVMSRFWVPSSAAVVGDVYEVFWPLGCFGVFFVIPLFLRRFARFEYWAMLFADSAVVALLTYLSVVERYVPKM
jgi:hypothetical protein